MQNKEVDQAVRTAGFSETRVWSGLPTDPQGKPGCGNPASTTYHQCYPPAVNYTPFYFLINGLAFDKANPAPSLFAATAGTTTTTGTVTPESLPRARTAGAPGECRPAHARTGDRRLANHRVQRSRGVGHGKRIHPDRGRWQPVPDSNGTAALPV